MRRTSTIDRVCLAIGRGALAGLAGTAAMTLSQTLEQETDAVHHLVYAGVAGATDDALAHDPLGRAA